MGLSAVRYPLTSLTSWITPCPIRERLRVSIGERGQAKSATTSIRCKSLQRRKNEARKLGEGLLFAAARD